MAVNPGTSLALGIGLTGKPESMARFVQMRAQGQAAAKKAKQDDIDAKNAEIRKQLMKVGGGARLPVFDELYYNKKSDVIRRLTEMAGNPDLNAATDMINGLAQDATRWEEQTKLFYADKNDANSYARKVLQTEKDPSKIAQALNNDAGTLKFDSNNPNLLIDDFTYEPFNITTQKSLKNDEYYASPTSGTVTSINGRSFSNIGLRPEVLPTVTGDLANNPNSRRSAEVDYQTMLRGQDKPINRQDKAYQEGFNQFFQSTVKNEFDRLQKNIDVTKRTGSTFNINNTGAGLTNRVGGINDVSFSYRNDNPNDTQTTKNTGTYKGFTFTKTKTQLGSNKNILDYNGNVPADIQGVSEFEIGQVAVMPFYKDKFQVTNPKTGKKQDLQGRMIDETDVKKQEKLGNVEYRVIVTGVGKLKPNHKNPTAIKGSELKSGFNLDATNADDEFIEIIRPLKDVQGAINTGFTKDEKIAFDLNVSQLNKEAARLQREADAMIEGGKKAPAAEKPKKSDSPTSETTDIEKRKAKAAKTLE
jgi:hypothetical protein